MFRDIAIPKDNTETEFIEIALRLGLKKLYFLYDFDTHNIEKIQPKSELSENQQNLSVEFGFIVNSKNINTALKESKLIVTKSSDLDKFFIESKKIKLIYGFEETNRKDYLYQRASGLNHTLCELAKKNDITIGFSYSSLFGKNSQNTSLLIGRMIQNINLCQKYKVKTIIASFSENPLDLRAHYDVLSLFTTLGMDKKRIKESLMVDVY